MINYTPQIKDTPNVLVIDSSWAGIPTILIDIISRFKLRNDIALEFGVLEGYSTTALANYFKRVIGVDTFSEFCNGNTLESVKDSLENWPNIELVKQSYEDFIKGNKNRYDLIHVDISNPDHNYRTTYECGKWAVAHSYCVLFHDTIAFPDVMMVCEDLSQECDFDFYHYAVDNGLGILIKKYV
jgi:hypothetical protein